MILCNATHCMIHTAVVSIVTHHMMTEFPVQPLVIIIVLKNKKTKYHDTAVS